MVIKSTVQFWPPSFETGVGAVMPFPLVMDLGNPECVVRVGLHCQQVDIFESGEHTVCCDYSCETVLNFYGSVETLTLAYWQGLSGDLFAIDREGLRKLFGCLIIFIWNTSARIPNPRVQHGKERTIDVQVLSFVNRNSFPAF